MIDQILDFSIDHAPTFIALLMVTVTVVVSGGLWAYGRVHERAMRRRETQLTS